MRISLWLSVRLSIIFRVNCSQKHSQGYEAGFLAEYVLKPPNSGSISSTSPSWHIRMLSAYICRLSIIFLAKSPIASEAIIPSALTAGDGKVWQTVKTAVLAAVVDCSFAMLSGKSGSTAAAIECWRVWRGRDSVAVSAVQTRMIVTAASGRVPFTSSTNVTSSTSAHETAVAVSCLLYSHQFHSDTTI